MSFASFAVRAKRSDKSFPSRATKSKSEWGGYRLDQLRAAGREVRVTAGRSGSDLPDRDSHRADAGVWPEDSWAGRTACEHHRAHDVPALGRIRSAVAAYKMMRRGAHMTLRALLGRRSPAGRVSVHVARALVERLVPYQLSPKLLLVPFEPIQRAILYWFR